MQDSFSLHVVAHQLKVLIRPTGTQQSAPALQSDSHVMLASNSELIDVAVSFNMVP